MCCLHHDGCHCRFDAIEQTSHPCDFTVGNVNPRQSDQHEQRRQHKQNTGHNAAPCFVHQPANVGGQLLGFWSGQYHAVIECMKKTFFRKPTPAHHQLFVHDGNLASRPTKADEAQLEPKNKGLPKTHFFRSFSQVIQRCCINRVHPSIIICNARMLYGFICLKARC